MACTLIDCNIVLCSVMSVYNVRLCNEVLCHATSNVTLWNVMWCYAPCLLLCNILHVMYCIAIAICCHVLLCSVMCCYVLLCVGMYGPVRRPDGPFYLQSSPIVWSPNYSVCSGLDFIFPNPCFCRVLNLCARSQSLQLTLPKLGVSSFWTLSPAWHGPRSYKYAAECAVFRHWVAKSHAYQSI